MIFFLNKKIKKLINFFTDLAQNLQFLFKKAKLLRVLK